ncbi:MAG: class B sortase [Eubacteriales bacterium]|nr:class B sortase [Eubacteriales bacterium]
MKKTGLRIIFVLALCICIGSAGYLGYRVYHNMEQAKKEAMMKEMAESTTQEKISIEDLLDLEFNGERDGYTTPIPDDVFTKDSDKKINFEKLHEYNDELIAWIYVKGTKIDYPIARHEGEDQTFYLNYDMYKEPSYSGCIYMEDLNAADFTDNNTIIYGHNMRNGTMFKGLHQFEDMKFFEKNKYIYIYLPDRTLVYEIFASYITDDMHILSAYDFTNEKVYAEYLANITDPHVMGANVREGTQLTTDDTIITLSTCVGGQPEERYLVQGVLKYDKKNK